MSLEQTIASQKDTFPQMNPTEKQNWTINTLAQ